MLQIALFWVIIVNSDTASNSVFNLPLSDRFASNRPNNPINQNRIIVLLGQLEPNRSLGDKRCSNIIQEHVKDPGSLWFTFRPPPSGTSLRFPITSEIFKNFQKPCLNQSEWRFSYVFSFIN